MRRTWQEEVVYLEGRVNSAYSELTDAETKLKDLKSSDKAAMTEIEDKNRDLRRKYDRYCAARLYASSEPIGRKDAITDKYVGYEIVGPRTS